MVVNREELYRTLFHYTDREYHVSRKGRTGLNRPSKVDLVVQDARTNNLRKDPQARSQQLSHGARQMLSMSRHATTRHIIEIRIENV